MYRALLTSGLIAVALGCGDQESRGPGNAAEESNPSSPAAGAAGGAGDAANGAGGAANGAGGVANGAGGVANGAGGMAASADAGGSGGQRPTGIIQTVFVIVMENQNWAQIKGSTSAPYINSLLAVGAHAENYKGGDNGNLHPSEPNYIWLEAGTNANLPNGGSTVTFTKDDDPGPANQTTTTQHLVSLLASASLSWKSYQEDIGVGVCPRSSGGKYAAKHNPMIFFTDVTNDSSYCTSHIRPFTDLAGDLRTEQHARYNFVTPNLCHDMHDFLFCESLNAVQNGDDWLRVNLRPLLESPAYLQNGALFLTWDEGAPPSACGASCPPIGMIVLSPLAKKNYANNIAYDHSSLVKTIQKIFGLAPLLGHAADAGTNDLGDLFVPGALP